MLHFLYAGSAYAPTGISSFIRSFMNRSSISVYSTDSETDVAQTKMSPSSNFRSNIRLLLWQLAERYYFFFALYRKLVYQKNAALVCEKLLHKGIVSEDIVVINDIWTLLEYQKKNRLDQVYFVFHCNGDLFSVFKDTFPSCKNKRFELIIDDVYALLTRVKGLVFLTNQARSIYTERMEANPNCYVINNGFGNTNYHTNEGFSDRYNIICTGTVCRRKRQYLLPMLRLNVLKSLDSVCLYGDGPSLSELKQQLLTYDLKNFRLEGKTNRPFHYYSFGDVFVLLSSCLLYTSPSPRDRG